QCLTRTGCHIFSDYHVFVIADAVSTALRGRRNIGMQKSLLWRIAFGIVLMVGMGFAAPAGTAQRETKAQNAAIQGKSSTGEADEREVRDGSIKVHGHWVIEVQNPNGTFFSHTEFENSLQSPTILAVLLSRGAIPGLWQIRLQGTPAPGP